MDLRRSKAHVKWKSRAHHVENNNELMPPTKTSNGHQIHKHQKPKINIYNCKFNWSHILRLFDFPAFIASMMQSCNNWLCAVARGFTLHHAPFCGNAAFPLEKGKACVLVVSTSRERHPSSHSGEERTRRYSGRAERVGKDGATCEQLLGVRQPNHQRGRHRG